MILGDYCGKNVLQDAPRLSGEPLAIRTLAFPPPEALTASSFSFQWAHLQDPEMQCLLLSDGKRAVHQNHVITLPAEGGGSMAAISFTGALKIPVSTGLGRFPKGGCLCIWWMKLAR